MTHSLEGYYREPTIAGNDVVFTCETDLWSVPASGGRAQRLTANNVAARSPSLSLDGQSLAFVGRDEGVSEVYVMPTTGGPAARLTWQGAYCLVTGWTPDGKGVRYISHAGATPRHQPRAFVVPAGGGAPAKEPWGPVSRYAEGPSGQVVLGRNVGDPARWKRYRGGRTGDLWIDRAGKGEFVRLLPNLRGNLADPMWIRERVYFLSDHEGHGNLYSCLASGDDLQRHTHHEDFYARNAKSDGRRVVYQCAAEIYVYEPSEGRSRKLSIQVASSKPQLRRRFVSPARYLEEVDVHPQSHSVALIVRGKPFVMGNWEQEVTQHGPRDGVRHRLLSYLPKGDEFVVLSDASGEEALEVHRPQPADSAEPQPPPERLADLDLGRPLSLCVCPVGRSLLVTNQRQELIHVDLDAKTSKVLDTSEYGRILGACWSPDGRWVAYGFNGSSRTSHIRIVEVATGSTHEVTRPVYMDASPCFDPSGRYLFFISYRTFNPIYDRMCFDLSFPMGGRPYVVTLRSELPSPFRRQVRSLHGDDEEKDAKDKKEAEGKKTDGEKGKEGDAEPADEAKAAEPKEDAKDAEKDSKDKEKGKSKAAKRSKKKAGAKDKKEKKKKKPDKKKGKRAGSKKDGGKKKGKKDESKAEPPKPVEIEFEGIAERLEALPVEEGVYGHVEASEDKLYFDRWPLSFTLDDDEEDEDEEEDESPDGTLYTFDLKELKEEHYASGIGDWGLALDGKTLVYVANGRVRVTKAGSKPEGEGNNRSSGWLNLNRVNVSIVPQAEWKQMFRDAWRLQRDHFWTPNMSGIDWGDVYERYGKVLERVATRTEFSDLMWEVQGELGTSHAYEYGGDHPRKVPPYRPGFLGCDFELTDEGWRVARIPRGDCWRRELRSSFAEPGIDVKEGDLLLSIEGQTLGPNDPPGKHLVFRADENVALVVKRADAPASRVIVRTLASEGPLRYRDWVEGRRGWVHEQAKGQVGYLHVPNMGPSGFAEFHRYYLAEFDKPGLIVDVRRNGGGHVSQLLLEKLARRRIGYDVPRWGKPVPYPEDARLGPVVCLTDEHAGSDGDIFSHCFKLLKLGPLVGRRTWGGVIGIWPRHALVDRTTTTQAEFAFWFEDVGWSVENYGTDPDVDVEIAPQDWAAGRDVQLEKGLEIVQRLISEQQPRVPDFGPRPTLTPPRLSKH